MIIHTPEQPPEVTPEQEELLVSALKAGCDYDEAAAHAGVSRRSFTAWLAKQDAEAVTELNQSKERMAAAEKMYKARMAGALTPVSDAQLSVAQGQSFLFVQERDEKGKNVGKPRMVTNPKVIEEYLSGNLEGGHDYYYITTKEPNPVAQKDILDRVIGKAVERVDHTTGGEKLTVSVINFAPKQDAADNPPA